jgi:hAT family C-terminal dimerisation region
MKLLTPLFQQLIGGLMNSRWQPALKLEQLLLSATTTSASLSVDDDLLKSVRTYHPHLNERKLKKQLVLLKTHNMNGTISDIIAWLQEVDIRETTYKSVYEAVVTLLVLPPTTASCERSFSGLRRVKTYLRSSMGQERLNSMIVSTGIAHLDILDSINSMFVLWQVNLPVLTMRANINMADLNMFKR